MKNKLMTFIIIVAIIMAIPVWRYFSHAQVFAKSVINHASGLGQWEYRSINSSFSGKITIRGLTLEVDGFDQKIEVDNVTISSSPLFIFKTSAIDLSYLLPDTLSMSMNSITLTNDAKDIDRRFKNESFWMLMAGYAGSFGCKRESYTSFDNESWKNIYANDQVFNLDMFYSRQTNGSLDVDLTIDAENQFSSTWSSNLKSSYNDEQIIADELIVDKLYYSYLDNGYNLTRNNACKKNYKASFAAYRLSSADHVQKYFRSYYSKELPPILISWYQRMLAPDVEYNAIITLDERRYLGDVFKSNQTDLYKNSFVEIATQGNEYLPVTLVEIDYTNKDPEMIKKENLKREQDKIDAELAKHKKVKIDYTKPKIFTTGTNKSRVIAIKDLKSYIDKKIRVKTLRGRPISGYLLNVNAKQVEIQFQYKTGTAQLSVELKNIASVELIK